MVDFVFYLLQSFVIGTANGHCPFAVPNLSRKKVNTILFRFDLIRFREKKSLYEKICEIREKICAKHDAFRAVTAILAKLAHFHALFHYKKNSNFATKKMPTNVFQLTRTYGVFFLTEVFLSQ